MDAESELPEGWAFTTLGVVAEDIQPGFACGQHNRHGAGVVHFRPMNVTTEGSIDLSNVKYIPAEEAEQEKRLVSREDVIFNNTNSGELVGKTAYYALPDQAAFSNHMTRVRCRRDALDPRFCAMALHQKWREGYFESICNHHVSQASVGRAALLETQLLLPPLAEQRRIVSNVEELLARVDSARERLARTAALLKRLRQSVLTAACDGRLTADWRQESTPSNGDLPEGWAWDKFGSLTKSFRSGSTEVPGDKETPYPVLRSSSVRPLRLDLSDARFLTETQSKSDANFLEDGDMLFTRLSGSLEYVANCAVVDGLNGRRVQYPDRLFCAKLREPEYVGYYALCFASRILRQFIELESKSSAGHQRISMGAITEYPIPVPPPAERREIVGRVDALFALAETIEVRIATATARAGRLTQSILAKAFRGELVPTEAELAQREGRDYEPASALLARIKSERAARAGEEVKA